MEKFPKEQELYKYLQQCYYKNYNLVGNDAANIMYNYQNSFTPMLIQINEGSTIKYVLELKGELPIKYKGQTYSIITSIGFPYIYPDAPCNLRIYNPDIQRFSINQHFIQGASQDQSVVNIQISEQQTWYQHRSIARVMTALIRELESHFPFFLKSAQQQPQQQPYGQPQQPYGQQYNQQPQTPAYNPYSNSGSTVYSGQQYQQNYQNQNYQQPAAQQYQPPTVQNYQPSPYVHQPIANQQQNPYNYNQSSSVINSGQVEKQLRDKCMIILDQELRQIYQDYQVLHEKHNMYLDLMNLQELKKTKLEQIENQVDQQLASLRQENEQLTKFVQENDILELNDETILKNITESDPLSSAILECYADIQANKETLHFLVHKFKHTNLTYESVLKLTRKVAEDQFNSVLLLKKLTKQLKK